MVTLSELRPFFASRVPRHTSYPPANVWRKMPSSQTSLAALAQVVETKQPVSLYLHVPFCQRLCTYCGCNRVVSARESTRAQRLLKNYHERLLQDVHSLVECFPQLKLGRVHWGGGTPNFLQGEQFEQLMGQVSRVLESGAEKSIELDPRTLNTGFLEALERNQFTHASLGVQDFDSEVQKAIGRVQPSEDVERATLELRKRGVTSVNFDLIYGLPLQTQETLQKTLEKTIALRPDRISFFRLALMPEKMPWQRAMLEHPIPSPEESIQFFLQGRSALMAAGYQPVGLDHFALPDDPLCVAQRDGTLLRSFHGMTTWRERNVIGLGPSAITTLEGQLYLQQFRDLDSWLNRVDADSLGPDFLKASFAGHVLDDAERLVAALIQEIYCQEHFNLQPLISFWQARDEGQNQIKRMRARLQILQDLQVIRRLEQEGSFELVGELGRLLRRLVAACVDPCVRDEDFLPPADGETGVSSYSFAF